MRAAAGVAQAGDVQGRTPLQALADTDEEP